MISRLQIVFVFLRMPYHSHVINFDSNSTLVFEKLTVFFFYPLQGRKLSRDSMLDDQYDGSLTHPRGRRSPSERNSYTLSSQYGNNKGYGYYPQPNRISISGNQSNTLYPDEREKLVRRDDPSRASTLSANTRNRLSTNV